jgi:hypothetical protein
MQMAPMRSTDVTIFGATGFTGQFVVAEAVRVFPSDIRLVQAAVYPDAQDQVKQQHQPLLDCMPV